MESDDIVKTILDNGLHELNSEHFYCDAFDSSWYTVGGSIDEGFFEGNSDTMM